MRVLIAGGGGFLGYHLCSRMLSDGHDVVCVDNLITGRRDNVEELSADARFTFLERNISTPLYVAGPLDAVLNFASPASPIDYLAHPIPTLKVGAIGTWHTLGLAMAKGATYFIASTSEVYGDPQIHPQPESYWGHVNPIGPRGVYDEAKRYAEAMTMAYHRFHGLDTRIVRIFNSVLADQPVVAFNDEELHLETMEDYAKAMELSPGRERRVLVPAFDPKTLRMGLRPASALIKHPAHQDAFELRLRYGRSVKVTGDHSVFVRGADGLPLAKPVREIVPGDHVAIPAYMPVVERDREMIDLPSDFASAADSAATLWAWSVKHASFTRVVDEKRAEMREMVQASGRIRHSSNVSTLLSKAKRAGTLPLAVVKSLGIPVPHDARIAPRGGSDRWVPARVPLTSDLLWLFGFYLAEGSYHSGRGVHFIDFSSDEVYLKRAQAVLEELFEVHVGFSRATRTRAPRIWAHSRVLTHLFAPILGLRERRIPPWLMQLPLHRLKHVLEGFRCGDGTHSGKKLGNELVFDTSSEQMALDLNYVLLRFGIVASMGRYESMYRRKYGDRRFPFYRLTVCEVDNFDILTWDAGVNQTLNARRIGDLVWAKVREVRPCLITGNVYDFSVPDAENFVAGSGVSCHNTFGPRMRPQDGRAVSTFIVQALKGEPMTVHGDGSQTRSFCYVDDMIEGFMRLLASGQHDPVNIGNPEEHTVLELAQMIKELTGSASEIVFEPRPVDDPSVRRPDIARARDVLGWEPTVPLQEGLERTITWFKTELGGA